MVLLIQPISSQTGTFAPEDSKTVYIPLLLLMSHKANEPTTPIVKVELGYTDTNVYVLITNLTENFVSMGRWYFTTSEGAGCKISQGLNPYQSKRVYAMSEGPKTLDGSNCGYLYPAWSGIVTLYNTKGEIMAVSE